MPLPPYRFAFVRYERPARSPYIDVLPALPQVHDAEGLGHWVHSMRQLRRRGQLSSAAVEQLDTLEFDWEVDVVTAKWYHNLHAARHYRVCRWD